MQVESGKFIEVHGWQAEALYFAKTPEIETDIYSFTLDFIDKRANFSGAQAIIQAMQADAFNLSASIAKFDLIFRSTDNNLGSARMAGTEFEYVFLVCRSIFDLMQELITKICDTVRLIDETKKKRSLKKSFSDMVLHGDTRRTSAELQSKFALPDIVADTYVRHSNLFLRMRKMRDNFVHRGYSVPTIFRTDSGFCISTRSGIFSGIDIWRADEKEPNELVPLKPLVGMLIEGTLKACDELATSISRCIVFPEPIVPGMKLYMRGYFNEALGNALEDARARTSEGKTLFSE